MPKHKKRYKHSRATIEKIRKARRGRKHSPETIEKIRASLLTRGKLTREGLLKPFHHTEATKRKLKKLAHQRLRTSPKPLAPSGPKKRKSRAKKSFADWLSS